MVFDNAVPVSEGGFVRRGLPAMYTVREMLGEDPPAPLHTDHPSVCTIAIIMGALDAGRYVRHWWDTPFSHLPHSSPDMNTLGMRLFETPRIVYRTPKGRLRNAKRNYATINRPRQAQILIVHPAGAIRNTLMQSLRRADYRRLLSVESAQHAFAILQTFRVDLIIAGLELADTDVWQFARTLQCRTICAGNPPFVVVTESSAVHGIEAVARRYDVQLYLYEESNDAPIRQLTVGSKRRALVIEDDATVADLIRAALEPAYDIDIALDGPLACRHGMHDGTAWCCLTPHAAQAVRQRRAQETSLVES
jgi:CheY-like chemotaxis protein